MATSSKVTLTSKAPMTIPNPPLYTALPALNGPSRKEKRKAKEAKASSLIDTDKSEELKALRQRKAWETAMAPAKNIPMQGFMMWMSGSTIQIFSAMAVINVVKSSIGGAMSVNQIFQAFENPKSTSAAATATGSSSSDATEGEPYALLGQKIAYCVCQALLFAVAVYKVHTMGLLPTHPSDWLAFVEPNTAVEVSTIANMG